MSECVALVNKESLGFLLLVGQKKGSEDVISGAVK